MASSERSSPVGLQKDRTFLSVSGIAAALPIDNLTPSHRMALAYWSERKGANLAPRRADIDPLDIPLILPTRAIWNIERGGEYRCRLAGTEIDRSLGSGLKGTALGDLRCALIDEARRE